MLICKPWCKYCNLLILENMVFLAITILSDLVTLIQKENSVLKGSENPETTTSRKDIRSPWQGSVSEWPGGCFQNTHDLCLHPKEIRWPKDRSSLGALDTLPSQPILLRSFIHFVSQTQIGLGPGKDTNARFSRLVKWRQSFWTLISHTNRVLCLYPPPQLPVLGIGPRVLCKVGKCSTTELISPALHFFYF